MKDMNETKKCKCCGRELPVAEFYRNALGVTSVCKECRRANYRKTLSKRDQVKHLEQDLADARNLRLEDFTPRELLAELKRRGYEWSSMRYVEIRNVDYDSI